MSSAYREAASVMDAVLSRKVGLRSAALGSNVKDKRKVWTVTFIYLFIYSRTTRTARTFICRNR
jgi:hypothetical protein